MRAIKKSISTTVADVFKINMDTMAVEHVATREFVGGLGERLAPPQHRLCISDQIERFSGIHGAVVDPPTEVGAQAVHEAHRGHTFGFTTCRNVVSGCALA